MAILAFMGAWLGASALLLGYLWICDKVTTRRQRRDNIIRQVNDARYI